MNEIIETLSKIFFILGIIALFVSMFFTKTSTEIGDCYDRLGSKIIGQECEVTKISSPFIIISLWLFLISFLLLIIWGLSGELI